MEKATTKQVWQLQNTSLQKGPLAEIAAAVGYKTPSAAQKRIMKLVEQFQAFLANP